MLLTVGQFGFDVNAGAVTDADLSGNLPFRSAGKAVGSDEIEGSAAATMGTSAAYQFTFYGTKSGGVIRTLGQIAL